MHLVRRLLLVVPPVLLVVLAFHPVTGWLLRAHLGVKQDVNAVELVVGFLSGSEEVYARAQSRLEQVARQHPNDYEVQLAWALNRLPFEARVQNLYALLERFPDRPSLCAHVLRHSTLSEVNIRRKEETLAFGAAPAPPPLPPPPPEVLAGFDRVAARGEKLDPDNAFFPMMRAVGYFAGKRDHEAVQSLLRASRKPRYDDYTHEEALSAIRLYTLAYGHQPVIIQVSLSTVVLFPHYASMRSLARMSQYMAMQLDRAGKAQQAAEIRLALMRCGSLMRAQSRSTIGSLVGIAISAIGGSLPRNTPAQPTRVLSREEAAQRVKNQRAEFLQYLRRVGKRQEAMWVEHEFRAMDETRRLLRQSTTDPRAAPSIKASIASARAGAVSMALLTAGISTLLLWGVWLLLSPLVRGGVEALFALVITLFVAGTALWFLPSTLSSLLFASGVAVLTAGNGGNLSSPDLRMLNALMNWVQSLNLGSSLNILRLFSVLAYLLWLALLAGVVTMVGIIRRQKASDALITGLRERLAPVAGFLFMLYACLLVYNAQVERYWSQEVLKMVENENAYRLRAIGKQIPH